jgi:hypothetical protein
MGIGSGNTDAQPYLYADASTANLLHTLPHNGRSPLHNG